MDIRYVPIQCTAFGHSEQVNAEVEVVLEDETRERFTGSDDDEAHGDFVLVDIVSGRHPGPATHGVFARWVVREPERAADFEASRRELFNLRRRHIDSFVADLLFRSRSTNNEYVVVGVYSSEEGLALARGHPAITAWAQQHPVSSLSAQDITGARHGTVSRWKLT